jgi:hypothetical protein
MELGPLSNTGIATRSIADSIVFYRDVMGACASSALTL